MVMWQIIAIIQVELLQSKERLVPKHKYCGLRDSPMAIRTTEGKM